MIKYMKNLDFSKEKNKRILKFGLYCNGYIPKDDKDKLIELMNENRRILCKSYV